MHSTPQNIAFSAKHKKESSYEGQAYTPEMEDEFVDDVVTDQQRRRKSHFYPKGVPSAFRAQRPSSVMVDKDRLNQYRDIGQERGLVKEGPSRVQAFLLHHEFQEPFRVLLQGTFHWLGYKLVDGKL